MEKLAAAVEALEQNANPEKPDDPMDERTQVVGDGDGAPVSDSADAKDAPDRQCGKPRRRERKLPRVDPPPVEDEPGQAIREGTPGYIAQASPRLFPHGTGDFHCLRGGMQKFLKFEEWGRFVLLWHDGRFMRHPRFRYWLLDTVLRTMTPDMQRTFFKTRAVATQYSLEDLLVPATRKILVQQMSTATSKLPGSVGERRKMRQELEAMVHQVEAENGGCRRECRRRAHPSRLLYTDLPGV